MQEYRINYSLLIGLIVGTLVCSGAIYGIHKFQNSRQSGWLIAEAEKASAEKNYRDAVQYYQQYMSIHNDDNEARINYANAFLDLAEQEDVLQEELGMAMQALETMLRNPMMAKDPKTKDVRRRLVTFYGRENVRLWSSALEHLKLLLEAEPNNSELQVLRATYLAKSGNLDEAVKYAYSLIGYDAKKDDFDAKKAAAPNAIEVYTILADKLRSKENNPGLAERVANQMVKANPKSAEAYVSRARLLTAWGNADAARADAQKAYQLDPKDIDVLLLAADIAAKDKEVEKAREYLATAKELHPKEARVYQSSAAMEMQQGKVDKAMAEFDAGAKAVGGGAAMNLQFFKARLQIEQNDLKGARQTIDDMQQTRKLIPEVADYFDALLLVSENKWYPAIEALSKLRPRISGFGKEMAVEIDFQLAMCYEKIGRWEQAQQYYEQIVAQYPQNAPAVAGVQRMKQARGMEIGKGQADPLADAMMKIVKDPKSQLDMSKLDEVLADVKKKRNLDDATIKLIKAQVAMVREDYDGATKLLIEADKSKPNDLQINRFKVQLARLNPKIGPAKALDYLQRITDQFGDQPALRLDKADILFALHKDKEDKEPLKQELASLLTGIDKWEVPKKVELWRGMSDRYLSLNMIDEARQCLTLAAENQPNELRLRLALFALALESNDEEGMKAAQDKILETVNGDQNDSDWLYAEARHRLWLLRRGQLGKDAIPEIRSLVKRALDQRPQGGDLYALLAEVELMSNNAALALKYYDQAQELGRLSPMAVAQHIRLLADSGRFKEAGKHLDRLPEMARQTLLGPRYAEILFQTDQVDAAIKQARTATEADPTSAPNQFWYGQLLARSSQDTKLNEAQKKEAMGKAIQAMHKATQLQPEFPDAWFSLINYNLMQDNENAAQKAMRDAQLVLSGDNLAMFLARSYEVLRRWFDAETMYREIYEIKPDDLQRAQLLAAFYLGPLYPRTDKKEKVTPLLNQLLRAGADGKIPPNDANLLWARRMSAKLLASTGDYQKLLKAENLLTSNSQDGSLLIEDRFALAEILAPRPEPRSKQKAIALLEEIDRVQPLNEAAAIQLGELYITSRGDWSKYASQMEKTIQKFPSSAKARDAYAQRLLARGDQSSIDRAANLADELRRTAPNYPGTFDLTVRIATKLGRQKQVRDELVRRLPNFSEIKELDEGQQQTFIRFANLLTELNDVETAEKIYRELAARNPKLVYELAQFIGLRRSPEQCFEKLNELYAPERIANVLTVAMTVARERRDKVGEKFDPQIQRWLDAGLRENPDSITLKITQADLFDLQKRYDESANVYRELLARKDLTGLRRAVVLNNLAFLVSLAGSSAKSDDDPMKLIAEATNILGPNSDILDTRAIVYTARKQYKEAIADLELAVTDGATASKYYHLALAHLLAGQSRAALEAWQKAEGLGLNRDALNRMEHEQYEKTKIQIDKIRGPSVTKSDGLRKAG